jgi:outer membrane protein TolC
MLFRFNFKNMFKCKWLYVLILLYNNNYIFAQQNKILTLDEYIKQVKMHHPVTRKASLVVDQSMAIELAAKAQFDPQMAINTERKDIDKKSYYDYQNYSLEMATKSPIILKGGHDRASGNFINPEFTQGGVTYFGVEIPLLSGFMIDQRRAQLAQAKNFILQSKTEQDVMINDLLLDAYTAYWQWAAAYQQKITLDKFITVAKLRVDLIKSLLENGDRSLADTIEAAVQYDYFKMQSIEANMQLINETFNLSSYLWTKDQLPYLIEDNYVPDTTMFNAIDQGIAIMVNSASVTNNPLLKIYNFKLTSLDIDQRLKKQYLMPKLDVKASVLRRDGDLAFGPQNSQLNDNFKLGLAVKYPIFARAAKAQLQENNIKTQMVQLDFEQKKWEYDVKARSLFNEYNRFYNQWTTINDIIQKNTQLRDVENMKFSIGESSLFLINSRESKILESYNKKIELSLKLHKTQAKIDWISGQWLNN